MVRLRVQGGKVVEAEGYHAWQRDEYGAIIGDITGRATQWGGARSSLGGAVLASARVRAQD